jgi:cyclophilin family peptidyl-prolyl cis-trans isomerase
LKSLEADKKPFKQDLQSTDAKVQVYKKRNTNLEAAMKTISKSILDEKYGKGPIYVDLILQLPNPTDTGETATIRLEMAPTDIMPVAVYYFLNLVSSGAWDGCSFIRNAPHVLQASNRGKTCDHKKFKDWTGQGHDVGIAFQEYSEKYPHKKYTVGLAGRPGGPDFYISILDNTQNHGPGGQSSYDLPSEADSCFATVLNGFDFIEKMKRLPIHPADNGYMLLASFVTIVRARVILE